MSKSKKDMSTEMAQMLDTMWPFMARAKIRVDQFELDLDDNIKYYTAELLRDALRWLKKIYQNSFKEVMDIWNQTSEDRWNNYFTLGGYEDFPEMILLKNALASMKTEFNDKDRPVILKKGKRNAFIKRAKKLES